MVVVISSPALVLIGLLELSVTTKYFYFNNFEAAYKTIADFIVPVVIKQFAFGYLGYYGGLKPLMLYRVIVVLYTYLTMRNRYTTSEHYPQFRCSNGMSRIKNSEKVYPAQCANKTLNTNHLFGSTPKSHPDSWINQK